MERTRITDFLLGMACAAAVAGWLRDPTPVAAQEPLDADAPGYIVRTAASSTGTALLFVLNTESKVMNVYEAEGGSRATRGLAFIASRKIERDSFVTGYNDRSEYSYQDLVKRIQLEEARASGPNEDDR